VHQNVKVTFTWLDVFSGKPTSQFSIAFEKACVIFNLASIQSQISQLQNRSETEGMKRACAFFQNAAGTYNYINENFMHAPSTDLSRESIIVLSTVMLAQAQECFVEKTIADGKKSSIVAKLAAETAYLYHTAFDTLVANKLRDHFDGVWSQVAQVYLCVNWPPASKLQCSKVKEQYFQALAHYFSSMACEENSKWGEAVARLTKASEMLRDLVKLAEKMPDLPGPLY